MEVEGSSRQVAHEKKAPLDIWVSWYILGRPVGGYNYYKP